MHSTPQETRKRRRSVAPSRLLATAVAASTVFAAVALPATAAHAAQDVITVTNDASADGVFVKLWPAGTPEPPDEKPVETTTTTTEPVTTTAPGGDTTTTTTGSTPAGAPPATPVSGTSTFTG